MVRVELTDSELAIGHMIGTMRRAALDMRHSEYRLDEFADHIVGVYGELAVAKALDIYWDASVNTFKSRPDVGQLEVRCTRYLPPRAMLYCSDRDDDDASFVLVCQESRREYHVVGWAKGSEIKSRGVRRALVEGRGPKHWLQCDRLNSLDELRISTQSTPHDVPNDLRMG